MELMVGIFIFYLKVKNKLIHIFSLFYYRNLKKAFDYAYLKYYGVETSYGYVNLIGFPIINRCPGSSIILKKGVTLVSTMQGNPAGINHRVTLTTYTRDAVIEIGEFSGASGTAIVAVTSVKIGKHCGIGANANIYDTDFHLSNPLKRQNQNSVTEAKSSAVVIGDNVWLNEGCLILKGVNIGYGAIIGPKSVVIKDVPEMEFHAGNPAKFVFTVSKE